MILATQYLTQYFTYIPKACLGSVIICAVINMVDVKIVRSIWHVNRVDMIPYVITFLACFYTLETGLLLGVAVSLVLLLKSSVSPPLVVEEREVCLIEVKSGVLFPGKANVFFCEQFSKRFVMLKFSVFQIYLFIYFCLPCETPTKEPCRISSDKQYSPPNASQRD